MKRIVIIFLIALSMQKVCSQQVFENITTAAKINSPFKTNSVSFNDFDNDLKSDILVIHNTGSQFYKNNGDLTFTLLPALNSLPNVISGGALLVGITGDYNNDGNLDIFIGGEYLGTKNSFLFKNDGKGVFAEVSDIGTLTSRVSASSWLDFDNDGNLDLFLGTVGESSNILLKNLGNNTFANHTANTLLTDLFSNTRGIATGDFDRDGDIDVFVPNMVPTPNYFFRNDGSKFSEIARSLQIASSAGNSHGAEFADYDNDGYLDLLIGDNGGALHLLKNNNGVSFLDVTALSGLLTVVNGFRGSSFNDFDNDGDLDVILLTNNEGKRTNYYLNNGDGRFIDATLQSGLNITSQVQTLAASDFDNDGKVDIYIGSYSNPGIDQLYRNITVARNWLKVRLIGMFSNKAGIGAWVELNSNSKKQYRQISTGKAFRAQDDLTQHFGLGDAKTVDSLKIRWPSGFVQVLTNISANQFLTITESTNLPAPPKNLMAAASDKQVTLKWDANTELDLQSYRIYGGTSPNPTTLIDSVPVGILGGTSKTITGLTNGTTYYYRITAVNLLLKESGFSNEVRSTPGLFTEIPVSPAGVAWNSVAWGDYDNDGDLDILLTGNTGSGYVSKIYRNDSGNFVDIAAPLVGVWESAIAWDDYDNDGDLDILLTGNTRVEGPTSKPVSIIYRNDGGNFVDHEASLIGVYRSSVAWGDYDNDGDSDILLTGESSTGIISKIYRNDKGEFVDIVAPIIGVSFSSVAWGDYDNDGDLDILLTGDRNGPISKIYRNDGGNFSDISASIQPAQISSVDWGDYDNDGDLDILLTGGNNGFTKIYRNVGGSFADISASLTSVYYGSAQWGDYDNDGDFDILLAGEINRSRIAKVFRNDAGSFVDINVSLQGVYTSSVTWGDYDNDGDLDVLLAGQPVSGGAVTKIYRNNISITNTVPIPPSNLTSSAAGNAVILSWNKSTDKETTQNGLTYNLRIGTTPSGLEIVSPLADVTTGYRKTPKLGNTNHNTRWAIENLPAGKYYWSVQAIDNAFAGSPFATEQSFIIDGTIDRTPPAPPKNLQATAGDKQITLRWDANTELDLLRYRIYGGIAPNPTTAIDSVLAALGTTKIITGLNNGTKYYFRITAVDLTLNVSGYSNEVSATPTTGPAAPNAPTNLAATPVSSTQINLTWSDNSINETSFEIERKTGAGGAYAVIATRPGDASTGTDNYSNTGLSPNTAYFYRVRAVLNSVTPILYSNYSNEVSATTFPAIPAAPSNLVASAISNSQIRLAWNAASVTGEEGFRIYRNTSTGVVIVAGNLVGSVGINIETFTDAGLSSSNTYYYKVVAFNVSGNSSPSNEASATPAGDKTPPTLGAVSYAQKVNLNNDAAVSLSITDFSGIKTATLYYRSGGAASFSSRAMTLQSGSTYVQTIPAAVVTNRGVEFYVTAEDGPGNISQSPSYPIQVYCPNGIANPNAQPSGKDANAYRIFSIPLDLDNKSPAAFLNANPSLGVYDNTKYRWYGFERSSQLLREYPNFGSMTMTPDMGFALLVNISNVKLKTGSGTTAVTTAPYNFALSQGWSLIGNPFNYNIPFDSLRVSAGTFELWSFEGDWQINTRGLEPWKGYAIWLSQAATFSIRPGLAGLKSTTSFYSVENNDAKNWLIQITAENGRSASRFNFAGQYAGATDNEDALDLHQPVRLANGVEVVFTKKSLKADIRQPSSNGHTWEFTCRLNPEDEVLSLTFDGVATVPQAFDVFLLEPETATAYNLRANPRLQFATHNLKEKRFQLVVGTKAYLNEQSLPVELYPSNFELLQNFPNPFNPSTQIIYSLPEAGHVEVSVYNIRGERVATLVNERQEMGSHTVVWNADEAGSGVYLIRIRAGRFESMKKCLFVK